MKKSAKWCIYLLIIIGAVFSIMKKQQWGFYHENYSVNNSQSNQLLIAHAGGSLELPDGTHKKGTNIKEAFEKNYNEGLRYFEGDLVYTSDHQIVLRHRWGAYLYGLLGQKKPDGIKENQPLSYAELNNYPLFGKYPTMNLDDLILFLKGHPDAFFITDIKEQASSKSFDILQDIVNRVDDNSILKRIIPQIYSISEYNKMKKIYDFPKVFLTLYNSSDSNEEIIEFIKKNKIGAIVCGTDIFERRKNLIVEAHQRKIPFYIHTINSIKELKKYKNYSIDGVYTDVLREKNKVLISK